MTTNFGSAAAAAALTLMLGACAMPHRGGMADHHAGGDMQRMCEMHGQMMAGKSPAEQRAAVEAHIRSMHGNVTPDHVERHMAMMQAHCGAPR